LKAGKVFFEAGDRTGHSKQVMKEFQRIKGMKISCKGFDIRELREFCKPHVKQASSKVDHKHSIVQTGVFPHCITSKIPGAEGCRWRILRLKTIRMLSLVVKSLSSSCLVRFELLLLNTDPCF
jgi:hypothetical protein